MGKDIKSTGSPYVDELRRSGREELVRATAKARARNMGISAEVTLDPTDQRATFIVALRVAPGQTVEKGSIVVLCADCRAFCWCGVGSQKAMAERPLTLICFACAKRRDASS